MTKTGYRLLMLRVLIGMVVPWYLVALLINKTLGMGAVWAAFISWLVMVSALIMFLIAVWSKDKDEKKDEGTT